MDNTSRESWSEISRQAMAYRDGTIQGVPDVPENLPHNVTKIPATLLSPEEVTITETTPEKLVQSIAAGHFTSTAVIKAFLRRAGIAQKLVNCITELLGEKAIARAEYLDSYFSQHKKPIGPLHGLPISVKEHIGMKGLSLSAGFVSWWSKKADDDAYVLKILWDAGCIFYARTTEPQTLMHLETSSNLYGETVNPWNRALTSGGSSGGEGALIGLRGSPLGLGTDIGGSVRSPAANCGIYSLRPTSYRIPVSGMSATMLFEEQIVAVLGPMSTSLEGLKLFMSTVIAARPWLVEPSLLPIPWRYHEPLLDLNRKKLKIGVLWSDEIVKPHPPILRALREVVNKLRASGAFDIVDWKPYNHDEAWAIIASLYFCDGGDEEADAINQSGEPWRPLSKWIVQDNPHVKHLSIEEVWRWTGKRDAYRAAYAKVWNDTAGVGQDNNNPVDVILCPVGPGVAPPLNQAKYWSYTSQWNLLDYPALVFPVFKADSRIDVVDKEYKPLNERDEFNHRLYNDPKIYDGLPVSLQLVARRYEDEKLIQALEYITAKIGLPFIGFP